MTEITWPSPYGWSYFCDDIREEASRKLILIGLYNGEMVVVGTLPIAIPKFVVAVQYFERPDDANTPLELRVYLPGDAEDAPSQKVDISPRPEQPPNAVHPDDVGEDTRVGLFLQMHMTPLLIKQEGRIKVRMKKGDDMVRLGSLRVRVMTPEEAQAAALQTS